MIKIRVMLIGIYLNVNVLILPLSDLQATLEDKMKEFTHTQQVRIAHIYANRLDAHSAKRREDEDIHCGAV